MRLEAKSNEYLKLHLKRENVHGDDREKASNIAKNIGLHGFNIF